MLSRPDQQLHTQISPDELTTVWRGFWPLCYISCDSLNWRLCSFHFCKSTNQAFWSLQRWNRGYTSIYVTDRGEPLPISSNWSDAMQGLGISDANAVVWQVNSYAPSWKGQPAYTFHPPSYDDRSGLKWHWIVRETLQVIHWMKDKKSDEWKSEFMGKYRQITYDEFYAESERGLNEAKSKLKF